MCPVGEDAQGKKLPWKQRLKDHLEFITSMLLTIGIVSSTIWAFARNEVKSEFQKFIGHAELVSAVSTQLDTMSEQLRVLQNVSSSNAEAIKQLLPKPKVSEYDLLRTRVFSPCPTLSDCKFQVRAKRSEFGIECGAPTVDARIVVDRYGLQHIVQPGALDQPPSRLDGEMRSISASFIVQEEIPLGVAEFMMRLAYECPTNGVGELTTIYEYTPRMAFEITE